MSLGDDFGELLRRYKPGSGTDRYARFASEVLGVYDTFVLKQLAGALDTHRQTVAVGGNGVGKSLGAAALGVSALYSNADTTVPITAGNGDTVRNSIWKPIKTYHSRSGLPGKRNESTRELQTGFDESWYLQCLSPRHPEDLEGDHNETLIYLIEEAEKPGVTEEHIDSARSTLTSENDRLLVLANPPTDESNVVSRLIDSEEWHTLRFPSWDSENVRAERGLCDDPGIDGLATVDKLRRDWNNYHDEPWPGLETAIEVSCPHRDVDGNPTVKESERVTENEAFRDDLHERWFKRRAGIMPPERSDTWRPFSISDVEQAYRRDVGRVRDTPETLGIDVARQVDETKAISLHGPQATVEYSSQARHDVQERELIEKVQQWPDMPIAVDAVGKGEPLADKLDTRFPDVRHFGNGDTAIDDTYRTKWSHGLQLIGEWLRSGGSFDDSTLYEELRVAATVVEFEENYLRSRGKVIEATSKEAIKEQLGRSPDALDALLMSLYARETDSTEQKASPTFSW